MAILPALSTVPQEVVLRQDYNCPDIDGGDVPPECRLYRTRSLDDMPAEWWDDERDHREWNHLLERLYVQGVRATRLS